MEKTLDQWLQYQLTTHPQGIAMGLSRVAQVAQVLGLARPARHVITVGGTNGKGSTVAFIEAIARAAGLRVGAFTSPHLLAYNERVRIDGRDASDAILVAAFERIEAARGDTPLTYFEFGTLAALLIFAESSLDLAILEVGLGGRLDAVNIIDADVSVITTVDIDHEEYLGRDRETIGADKAGIFRAGKPCVLGERDPPSAVLRRAYELGAPAIRAHADYLVHVRADGWTWAEPGCALELPLPAALSAPAQLDNAAAAIAALRALPVQLPEHAFADGIASARVPGRLQVIGQAPEVVVDVAHNVQAAEQLAKWLALHPMPTFAVFSALKDKDIEGIAARLGPYIQQWFVAGMADAGARGLSGVEIAARLAVSVGERCLVFDDVAGALLAARRQAPATARVLVFGSFHTAAAVLKGDGGERERV